MQQPPDEIKELYDRVTDLRNKQHYDEALSLLNNALKSAQSDTARIWIFNSLAHIYNDQKLYDKAIDQCKIALKTSPSSAIVWSNLGTAYGLNENHDEAIMAFRKSLKLDPSSAKTWSNLGVAYGLNENHDEAIMAFRKSLELDPSNAKTWSKLGVAYKDNKNHDEAIKAFRKSLELDPSNAKTWSNLGVAYGLNENHDEAIMAFRKSLELDPSDATVWSNLGIAYEKNKNHDEAIKAFRKSLELDPSSAKTWSNLGIAYGKNKNHDEAIKAFRKSLELDPSDATVWPNLGIAYGENKNHDEAIKAFQKSLELDPSDATVWSNLGIAYGKNKNHDEAIMVFQKSLELDPSDATVWSNLGIAYRENKNHDEAIKAFRKSLELDSSNAKTWSKLGVAYKDNKNHAEAIKAFRKSLELDPSSAKNWSNLGIAYRENKNHNEAIKAFRKSLELDPSSAKNWSNLGIAYRENKNHNEAIKAFRKSLELDPSSAKAWSNLGVVYEENKNHDEAIKALQKSLELDPSDATSWSNLGVVYDNTKAFDEAVNSYRKSIDLDNLASIPWNGLGVIYSKQKLYGKAIEAYKKAINLNSSYAYPWGNLGHVYEEQRNYAEALKCYQTAISTDPNDHYFISQLKQFIAKTQKIIASEMQLTKNDSPEAGILQETKQIVEDAEKNKLSFLQFIEENRRQPESSPCSLEVLRKWNSFTPIVTPHNNDSLGGGYLLRVGGKGIVIDPGFDFIKNYKEQGHFFAEMDLILLSHAHNDHIADLESILSLLYKYNDNIKHSEDKLNESTIKMQIAKRKNVALSKVLKAEIEEEFERSGRKKVLKLYLSQSVYDHCNSIIRSNANACDYEIAPEGHLYKLGVATLKALAAKHANLCDMTTSRGFCLDFSHHQFIYTGDTGWDKSIETQYRKLAKANKIKPIVLLAHIGGVKENEIDYLSRSSKDDYSAFYPNHLGRLGLCKLVSVLNPRICIISEFGEELLGHRVELAKLYHAKYPDTIFLAADIGLKYDIENNQVRGIQSIDKEKRELVYGYSPPEKIEAYENEATCTIYYYDNKINREHVVEAVCYNYKIRQQPIGSISTSK